MKNSTTKKNHLDQLITRLFAAHKLMRQQNKPQQRTAVDPSSMIQMHVLYYLSEHAESTMKDVARYLGITPPSATSLINGLVKAHDLQRTADAHDRRKIHLSVTKKGTQRLKKGLCQVQTKIRGLLMRLNASEQEQLIKIIEKLSRSYETEHQSASTK